MIGVLFKFEYEDGKNEEIVLPNVNGVISPKDYTTVSYSDELYKTGTNVNGTFLPIVQ